jgi:hypothetical protein
MAGIGYDITQNINNTQVKRLWYFVWRVRGINLNNSKINSSTDFHQEKGNVDTDLK